MKTTILGVLLIVGALTTAATQYLQGLPVDYAVLGASVAAGVGFLNTEDQKKPGK